MSSRLNLSLLVHGVRAGLKHRATGDEEPDNVTRSVLVFAPLAAFAASFAFGFRLESAGDVIGAFGLLAGVLLAAFTQLAAWRSQLSARSASYGAAELPDRRAIDEAVAHTLWASFLSVLATLLSIVASMASKFEFFDHLIPKLLTGSVLAVGVYIAITFVIIVNLLWDGYNRSTSNEETESRRRQHH